MNQLRLLACLLFFWLSAFTLAFAQESALSANSPDLQKREAACISKLQDSPGEIDTRVLEELGSVYVLEGKLKQAEDLYRKYLAIAQLKQADYGKSDIAQSLIAMLEAQNRFQEAETLCSSLLKESYDSAECERLGMIFIRNGKFKQAAAAFKQAKTLVSEEPAKQLGYTRMYIECLNRDGKASEASVAWLDFICTSFLAFLSVLPKQIVDSLLSVAILWLSKSYLGFSLIRRNYQQKSAVWCGQAALVFFAVSVLCMMAWKPYLTGQDTAVCLLLGYLALPLIETLYLSYRVRVRPDPRNFGWLAFINVLGMITTVGILSIIRGVFR